MSDTICDERPDRTPERNLEVAVRDTHPASDPPATTATQGARAVPAEQLMDAPCATPDDAQTVSRRFPDAESAKLAVESLVRDAPIDRRCADIRQGGDGVTVAVAAPRADAQRIRTLLERAGGEP